MWDIFLSMARQYSRNLSEEVKKGQRVAVAKGLMPSGRKIGYLSVCAHGEHAAGKSKSPDPSLVPVIREIFQRLATGHAASEVYRWIRQDGRFKNTHGNTPTRARFYLFIRDPFVCGQFVFGSKLHEGKHKPIISQSLFCRVQDVLDGRRNVKRQRHCYLYSGLAVDSSGRRMRCATSKGIAYYRPHQGGAYTPERVLEAAVVDWFRAVAITDYALARLHTALQKHTTHRASTCRDARSQSEGQLARLERREKAARGKLLDGIVSDEDYQCVISDIRQQRQDILRHLPRNEAVTEKKLEPMYFVLKALQNLGFLYPRLAFEAKRAIAQLFVLELCVKHPKVCIQSKSEVERLLKVQKMQDGGLTKDACTTLSLANWSEYADILHRIIFRHDGLAAAFRPAIHTVFSDADPSCT